ncbi:MAG: hypothetical protein IIV16_00895 [Alistipes sp.]|nr:hypothetical protein [Alistipes sp.]
MKRVFIALFACATLLFTGCIDREFDIADTSGEITVGGEELLLPLGDIDKITLDSLLGNNQNFTTDENGVYQIRFSSYGDDPTKYEKVSIDGISIPNLTNLAPELEPIDFSFGSLPSSLLFSAIEKPFPIDYPTTIGDVMVINPINIKQDVDFSLPSQLSGQGTIDNQTLSLLEAMQLSTITSKGENEVVFQAKLHILEQLDKVDWVEFGCEDHPYGAPFNLKIDLKGMSDVIGGGTLKLNVNFPEGYYLRDENGTDFPVATHNILSKEITLAAKQKEVDVLVYLHKIDYSDHTFTNGVLDIDDHIKYSYEISARLGVGNFNTNSKPQMSMQAAPEYKDVEVRIKHFELPKQEYTMTHSFNGIPSGIDIKKIAFIQGSNLTISVKGLEWCVVKDNQTGDNISPKIEIDMPRCMHFREHPLLDETTNVLLASTTELSKGITLSLEYLDCENTTGLKQENGQLLINEKITAAIHMESLDGHAVLVSSITPPANWAVTMSIAESKLELDTTNSVVTWGEDKSFDFNLKDNIPHIAQSVDVPEMIADIERIEIGKANSDDPVSMNFKLDVGNTFPVNELDIDVAVNLGKLLRPTQKMLDEGLIKQNENGDYILSIKESWQPKSAPMVKTLEFDALQNLPDITDGKITINQSFPVTGSVKIKSGENIDLSATSDAKVNIDFAIDDIEIRSFTGKVDLSVKPESMFVDLGLGNLEGLNIGSLNINPILTLRLKDNPTGVGLNANVLVKTFDKDDNHIATINVPTIPIAGNGASTIVISTPYNAPKFEGKDVTFIAVNDLSQILKNLPHKIGVDMAVTSNKDEEITIDLKKAAEGYNIEYQYDVQIPFEFNDDIDLGYEVTISNLNETFVTLADNASGITVGDVGLVAELGTTIPFNIVVSAWLVNANGTTEDISARLNLNECLIKGYNKEVDGEKKVSNLEIGFDLSDGGFEGLRAADGVRLKFSIYDTGADSAALSKEQFIDGKLKLRVRDGLTVDLFDFLNLKGEDE